MQETPLDDTVLDAWIAAAAPPLGIEVKPEWRPALRQHLRISMGHALAVLAVPSPDHLDPAPVFHA